MYRYHKICSIIFSDDSSISKAHFYITLSCHIYIKPIICKIISNHFCKF